MRLIEDCVNNNDDNFVSGQNECRESICLVSSIYYIINESAILCVNTNKAILSVENKPNSPIGLVRDPEGFSNKNMVGHIWLNNDDLEVLFSLWINLKMRTWFQFIVYLFEYTLSTCL